MSSRISPSSLQSFNNDLIRNLTYLIEQRHAIVTEIRDDEAQKETLTEQIQTLQDQLNELNQSLSKKLCMKEEFDRVITETEDAYVEIVESSQALLNMVRSQTDDLLERDRKPTLSSSVMKSHG
ncbi:Sjoegren syndrome nuclear autoantigen 1 [Gaertneriomyces sp. JEL0708]|nr:Sjoegren syndrome nuclear autoantigen 1 [Gaertneriomyces sp. JEL0708]